MNAQRQIDEPKEPEFGPEETAKDIPEEGESSAVAREPEDHPPISREVWRAFCLAPGEASFAELYQCTSAFIGRVCFRVTDDEEEAFDAAQAVYAQLLEMASEPEAASIENIDDLIYRVSLREADRIRQWKRRRREKDAGAEVLEWVPDRAAPADLMAHKRQLQDVVSESMDDLPDEVRRALHLHYFAELTHDQVAAELKVSRSAATRLIYRGHRELEKRLRAMGITESAIAVLLTLGAAHLLSDPAAAWSASAVRLGAQAKQDLLRSAPPPPAAGQHPSLGRRPRALSAPKWAGLASAGALLAALLFLVPRTFAPSLPPPSAAPPSPQSPAPVAAVPATPPPLSPQPSLQRFRPAAGQFSGRILALADNSPLHGTRILLQKDGRDEAQVVSGPDGLFTSPPLPPGSYTLKIEPERPYGSEMRKALLVSGTGYELGDIRLRRLGSLRGRVVNADRRNGISDVHVEIRTAYSQEIPHTRTDSEGRFEFLDLPYPYYKVLLKELPTLPQYSVEIPEGGEEEIELVLGDRVLTGTVTRAGLPLPGVDVFLRREVKENQEFVLTAPTQADGSFSLGHLMPGRYKAVVRPVAHPHLAKQTLTTYVDVSSTSSEPVELELASGRLVGRVTDAGGNPLPGVPVRVVSLQKLEEGRGAMPQIDVETSSTADGQLLLEGLPPGPYCAVAAGPDGAAALSERIDLPHRGDCELVNLVLRPASGATIRVTALDRQTGLRLENSWVCLATSATTYRWPARQASDGSLLLEGVPQGTYTAEISANGFSSDQRTVSIGDGETTELTAVLHQAGAVEWTLVTQDRKPAALAECAMVPLNEEGQPIDSSEYARTESADASGIWTVRGLPPGRYRFSAVFGSFLAIDEVEIHPHNLTEKLIVLEEVSEETP